MDDELGRAIAAKMPSDAECIAVGRKSAVRWTRVSYASGGLEGTWVTPWGREAFSLPGFFGEFSIYNAACALGACCASGMPLADVVAAMARLSGVPGRMQLVARSPTVAWTTLTRQTACARCSARRAPICAATAGSSWYSAAAVIATAASGRRWHRSRRPVPNLWSLRLTTHAAKTRSAFSTTLPRFSDAGGNLADQRPTRGHCRRFGTRRGRRHSRAGRQGPRAIPRGGRTQDALQRCGGRA